MNTLFSISWRWFIITTFWNDANSIYIWEKFFERLILQTLLKWITIVVVLVLIHIQSMTKSARILSVVLFVVKKGYDVTLITLNQSTGMLTQQIKETWLVLRMTVEEAVQLCTIVLDSIQYSSNLQALLANSERRLCHKANNRRNTILIYREIASVCSATTLRRTSQVCWSRWRKESGNVLY